MFKFVKTDIPGVILIEPQTFEDDRGFFCETYKKSEFFANGIKDEFVQDNHTKSKKNVLRGLHCQTGPFAQAKLVRCIKGSVFDVAVDTRKNSPSYLKWRGYILSEQNKNQLYVPAGLAHGFCALEDGTEIVYKCSQEYSPGSEVGIIWNDPKLAIRWPVEFPILSAKDSQNILISEFEKLLTR